MNKFPLLILALILHFSSSINLFSQNVADREIPKDDPVGLIKLAEDNKQKPELVIQFANLALTQLSKTDRKDIEAKAYYLLGKAYFRQNQLNSAIDNFKQSAHFYKQINDSIKFANVVDYIGICYQMKSQYGQALEYLQQALLIAQKLNNDELNGSILSNIGIIYQQTNQLEKSITCFNNAIQIFEKIDNKIGTSSTQNNLGLTYNLMGKYEDALLWFSKAIKTKKEIKDTLNLAGTYESMGQVHEKIENYSKAIEYFTESLKLQNHFKNKIGISNDLTSLARVYIKTKNYQKAYENIIESEKNAQGTENSIILKENKKLLSEYYLAVGNPYQSREMMLQYAVVVEKIFNKQVSDRMAEMTVQYETEQKDYQNKLLQANLEIERYKLQRSNDILNFLITLSILVIILLLYSIYLLKRLRKKNRLIEQINEELNVLNLELEEKVIQRTKELSEALYRAEQSDRLKSAFLANMSHEIRTPMNGILGFAKILENDDIPADDRKLYLDVINRQGRSLLQIINDIISLSKIETDQIEIKNSICNLNKVIDDLYLMFKSPGYLNKKENVDLKIVKPLNDDDCNVITDPVRVEQILKNLIDNALKFTSKGEVEFGYSIEKSNTIKFYVKDTGQGIPKDQQEKIFDRFYKHIQNNQPTLSGAGLGLSISKKLANLINGELLVESETSVGSTFFLAIPFLHVDLTNQVDANQFENKTVYQWPNKVILVVEDDNISYQYIEALLLSTKATVIHATNGEEAIAICRSSDSINLILMDIQLPFMSGYETTKQIKAIRKSLPIIAQTANVMNDEKNRSLEAGCNYYISKPIDQDELFAIISKCLDKC